jgi:hypothetical protein
MKTIQITWTYLSCHISSISLPCEYAHSLQDEQRLLSKQLGLPLPTTVKNPRCLRLLLDGPRPLLILKLT